MTAHSASRHVVPLRDRDHLLGPATAPATLVEYGDYECPYCGAAHPVVAQLVGALGNRLCFAFRHFPLAEVHPHAELAAEAAEAAGAQGRFWVMHDTLFASQDALDPEDLLGYAAALGLKQGPFRQALAEHTYAGRVREDFLSGARSGVNGTPTFFVNGVRYDGPRDFDSMLAALSQATEES